jgi:hypothetical protein
VDNSQFGEIYLPIQRLVVHCGREYGRLGLPFPSHRRTRRDSGPIATVQVIRQGGAHLAPGIAQCQIRLAGPVVGG